MAAMTPMTTKASDGTPSAYVSVRRLLILSAQAAVVDVSKPSSDDGGKVQTLPQSTPLAETDDNPSTTAEVNAADKAPETLSDLRFCWLPRLDSNQ
jgi:hypothetical protein